MVTLNYKRLARQICDSLRMGRKPNPGIKKAEKDFGRNFVKKLLKKKTINPKAMSKKEQEKIQKLMDMKYGPLVYKSTSGKLKVKKEVGEVMSMSFVDVDERVKKLAMAVRDEAWRRGCHVSVKSGNDADLRLYYKTVPEDTLTEFPPFVEARTSNIDATLSIGDSQDPEWSKGFEKRILLGAPTGQRLHQIIDKKRIRWCLFGFPVKMSKRKYYLVPPETYERVYLASIKQTFNKETQKLCRHYYNALRGGNRVHITAKDGTDLALSIKSRPVLIADGLIDDWDMKRGDVGLNIPDGEAFLAPLEHSANGRIFFDYVNTRGFGFIRGGLWVTFKNGKVVEYHARDKKETQKFTKFLNANTGEKDRIAELGIGTNKAARFIGTIVVDEKIFGSIHIAIGNNTGAYHGKNKASSHLDMIKMMSGRGGNVYVDGKLIMRNGLPVGKT